MRDLTETEIEEYFRFAKAAHATEGFHQDQTNLIGQAALDSGLLDAFVSKIAVGLVTGLEPRDMLLSVWVSGFQMGRECESRLLTLALKKQPGWKPGSGR